MAGHHQEGHRGCAATRCSESSVARPVCLTTNRHCHISTRQPPDGDWLFMRSASICDAAGCETEPRFSRCRLIGETTTNPRLRRSGQTIEELARFSPSSGAGVSRHFCTGLPATSHGLAEPRGAQVAAGV